jgi:hypothetical protein
MFPLHDAIRDHSSSVLGWAADAEQGVQKKIGRFPHPYFCLRLLLKKKKFRF